MKIAAATSVASTLGRAALDEKRFESSSGNVQWHIQRSAAMTRAPSLNPKSTPMTALRAKSSPQSQQQKARQEEQEADVLREIPQRQGHEHLLRRRRPQARPVRLARG